MGFRDIVKSFFGPGGATDEPPEPPLATQTHEDTTQVITAHDVGGEPTEVTQKERDALFWIIERYLLEDSWSYRQDLFRCTKADEYWANNMYQEGESSDGTMAYGVQQSLLTTDDEGPADDGEAIYSIPSYRGYGLSFVAVVAARVPGVRFTALNPESRDDVAAARSAGLVAELFRRNNKLQPELAKAAKLLWNHGRCYAWVRHQASAQRFGFTVKPIIEYVPQILPGKPAEHICAQCGASSPPEAPACVVCGAPLGPTTFIPPQPPQPTMVPRVTGTKRTPNGAEVVTIHSALEVRTPAISSDMSDFPYLHFSTEVDRSALRAVYGGEVIDKAPSTMGSDGDVGELQRRVRMTLRSRTGGVSGSYAVPYDPSNSKMTLSRVWLRPYTFFRDDLPGGDEVRDSLLARFPEGVSFDLLGNTVIGTPRAGSMDDEWKVCHAHPGEGQFRESVGDAMLDCQDASNDLLSSAIDAARHSSSKVFANKAVINQEAMKNSKERAGQFFPINMPGNGPARDAFYETQMSTVGAQHVQLQQILINDTAQFVCGVLPAVMGQGDADLKTAAGFAMARDQALGRIGTPYRALKEFFVGIYDLGVIAFIKNRKSDTLAAAGDMAKLIRLEDLKGEFRVAPESDDGYPVVPSDVRDVVMGYANNPDMKPAFFDPDNYGVTKQALGPLGFKFPGEKAYAQQEREIEALLRNKPQPVLDAMGMPALDMMGQPILRSSVPIDPVFDDSPAHFTAIQKWLQGEKADEAKIINPLGFKNVWLHGLEHHQAIQAMQAGFPPPGAPMPPMPPPEMGGPPPPGAEPPMGPESGAPLEPPPEFNPQAPPEALQQAPMEGPPPASGPTPIAQGGLQP